MFRIAGVEIMTPDKQSALALKVLDRYKTDPDFIQLIRQLSVDAVLARTENARLKHRIHNLEVVGMELSARMQKMRTEGRASNEDPDYYDTYGPVTQFIALLRTEGGAQNHDIANMLDKIILRAMTLERIIAGEADSMKGS